MRNWRNWIMGRSVKDLASDVDDALGALAYAKGQRDAAQLALDLANGDVRKAEADVQSARDALFKEHPELAGPTPIAATAPTDGSAFEIIEVDDENDIPGAGPIQWAEHDA